jgi:hypothetical protein
VAYFAILSGLSTTVLVDSACKGHTDADEQCKADEGAGATCSTDVVVLFGRNRDSDTWQWDGNA